MEALKILLTGIALIVGFANAEANESLVAAQKNQKMAGGVCVTFNGYADNTKLGSNEAINGIVFHSLNPKKPLDVNLTDGELFLRFSHDGLAIIFLEPANRVLIEVAKYNTTIILKALDDPGNTLEARTIDVENATTFLDIQRDDYSIDKLILSGGGNEGGVGFICARMKGKITY